MPKNADLNKLQFSRCEDQSLRIKDGAQVILLNELSSTALKKGDKNETNYKRTELGTPIKKGQRKTMLLAGRMYLFPPRDSHLLQGHIE